MVWIPGIPLWKRLLLRCTPRKKQKTEAFQLFNPKNEDVSNWHAGTQQDAVTFLWILTPLKFRSLIWTISHGSPRYSLPNNTWNIQRTMETNKTIPKIYSTCDFCRFYQLLLLQHYLNHLEILYCFYRFSRWKLSRLQVESSWNPQKSPQPLQDLYVEHGVSWPDFTKHLLGLI